MVNCGLSPESGRVLPQYILLRTEDWVSVGARHLAHFV